MQRSDINGTYKKPVDNVETKDLEKKIFPRKLKIISKSDKNKENYMSTLTPSNVQIK